MITHIQKHPMLVMVVGIIGVSLSAIFVRFSQAPSAMTAAYRLVWTVLLMTPAVFGKKEVRKELRQIRKKTAFLSGLSGFFLAIHFALWFESLQHTSVASSTTIVCTEVIWVSLGFWLFLKGKIPRLAVIAIAITLAGSVLIAFSDSSSDSQLYGDCLALLAALAAAVYMLIGRVVREKTSTTVYTYLAYSVCAGVLVILCLVQGMNPIKYGWSGVIVGLLLAVFSTLLGHSIFSWGLKFFSPSFVSASKLCEPVVAALLAVPLFGEYPSLLALLGGGMILGGVYWYSRIERKTASQ